MVGDKFVAILSQTTRLADEGFLTVSANKCRLDARKRVCKLTKATELAA
jgi:hypothetical protein